jgi:hypothetical protein
MRRAGLTLNARPWRRYCEVTHHCRRRVWPRRRSTAEFACADAAAAGPDDAAGAANDAAGTAAIDDDRAVKTGRSGHDNHAAEPGDHNRAAEHDNSAVDAGTTAGNACDAGAAADAANACAAGNYCDAGAAANAAAEHCADDTCAGRHERNGADDRAGEEFTGDWQPASRDAAAGVRCAGCCGRRARAAAQPVDKNRSREGSRYVRSRSECSARPFDSLETGFSRATGSLRV